MHNEVKHFPPGASSQASPRGLCPRGCRRFLISSSVVGWHHTRYILTLEEVEHAEAMVDWSEREAGGAGPALGGAVWV